MSKDPETQWREAALKDDEPFQVAFLTFMLGLKPSQRTANAARGFTAGFLAASPKRPEVEEVARVIHAARFAHPTQPSAPEPLTDPSDIEYATRLARAASALIFGEPKTEEGKR